MLVAREFHAVERLAGVTRRSALGDDVVGKGATAVKAAVAVLMLGGAKMLSRSSSSKILSSSRSAADGVVVTCCLTTELYTAISFDYWIGVYNGGENHTFRFLHLIFKQSNLL